MARKRSECEMKKVGFFYVPQWPVGNTVAKVKKKSKKKANS